MEDFKQQIERIKNASPLKLPSIIQEVELHDKKSASEIYDEFSKRFENEGIIDNVVTPVIGTFVDAVLEMRCFRGASRKMGLTAQRIMSECKSFNYDGRIAYLMPDSFVESKNMSDNQRLWGEENRAKYIREQYQDTNAMNKYKKQRIEENGGRVNMMDEYRGTKDITGTKASPDKRRNDPKHEYNAEIDHIIPLKTAFKEMQNNSALSPGDIKRIANDDSNFAVTGHMVNNAKSDSSNRKFIKDQDKNKREGKPYVELDETQRARMIQMEDEAQKALDDNINNTVLRNLSGQGQADRENRKKAMDDKQKEVGRPLTLDERKAIDDKLAKDKAFQIHKDNVTNAGGQSLMYVAGNVLLLVIKPLYYEIKDIMMNGMNTGVQADSTKQAIRIRFTRIKNYVWDTLSNVKNMLSNVKDFIKGFVSALIEGFISMFVGILKNILRVLKEGVKIGIQAYSILFGEKSKSMTSNEKGDAIIKVLGSSVVALCGIGINFLLGKLNLDPDVNNALSTVLSGIASILLFYALDKADLFNVKKEKREKALTEIFNMRIQDIKEKTQSFKESASESIRASYIKSINLLQEIHDSAIVEDYENLNKFLDGYRDFMMPNKVESVPNWDC